MGLIYIDSFEAGTNPGVYSDIGYSTTRRTGTRGATAFGYPLTSTSSAIYVGLGQYSDVATGEIILLTATSTVGGRILTHSLTVGNISDGRVHVTNARTINVLGTETPKTSVFSGFHTTFKQWHYYELYGLNNGATTEYEVRVNNKSLGTGTFTWTNTDQILAADWQVVRSGFIGGGIQNKYDDFYVANDAFYGDMSVKELTVTSNGAVTQWTPFPGTLANYQCVDEVAANGDTDYIYATEGSVATDLFGFGTFSTYTGGTIYPMFSLTVAINTTTATGSLFTVHIFTDGTSTNTTTHTWSTTFSYALDTLLYGTNPFTTAAWLIEDIPSIQYGPQQVN